MVNPQSSISPRSKIIGEALTPGTTKEAPQTEEIVTGTRRTDGTTKTTSQTTYNTNFVAQGNTNNNQRIVGRSKNPDFLEAALERTNTEQERIREEINRVNEQTSREAARLSGRVRSQRIAQGRTRVQNLTNDLRSIGELQTNIKNRLSNVGTARAQGRDPNEIAAQERQAEAQARAQEARRIEQEKVRFERERGLSEGVQSTRSGRQLIVTKGSKATTAGELVRRLEGKTFEPVRQQRPAGLQGKVVGVRQDDELKIERVGSLDNRLIVKGKVINEQYLVNNTEFNPPIRRKTSLQESQERVDNLTFSDVKDLTNEEIISRLNVEREKLRQENTLTSRLKAIPVGFESAFFSTRQFFQSFSKNPGKTSAEALGAIGSLATGKTQAVGAGKALRDEPGFSTGNIAFEALVTKGTNTLFFKEGSVVELQSAVSNLKFSPVRPKEGTLGVIETKTSEGVREIKIAGAIGSKTLPAESLSLQASRAGQTVTGVSGARDLVTEFRRFTGEITVDKPIKPGDPELERSFFIDPDARLRPTRLGITESKPGYIKKIESKIENNKPLTEKEKLQLLDYRTEAPSFLTDDLSFTKEQPQAIIFPKAKIAEFPKELQNIERKLKANKDLTPVEQKRLLEFQLTPSGEFKPVGFISRESEATLAPGEVIVVKGDLGTTVIGGRKVEIIEATVKKGVDVRKGERVFASLDPNVRTSPEFRRRTGTGRKVSLESPGLRAVSRAGTVRRTTSRSIAPRSPVSPASLIRDSSIRRTTSTIRTASPLRRTDSPVRRGGSRASGASPSRATSTARTVRTARIVSPPKRPPLRPSFDRREQGVSTGFNVFANIGGSFKKLNTQLLTRSEAITLGTSKTSRTKLASFQIRKGGAIDREDKGLSLQTRRTLSQFRAPKRGTKLTTQGETFVEKRRFRINTPGELKDITFKGQRSLRGRL